ncbi:Uncharacterized protein GBIM_20381 [Gryllus bimaculatus]|nr:Uncharacterized protein GBIM_20381 [Gryllus bimaculatus]
MRSKDYFKVVFVFHFEAPLGFCAGIFTVMCYNVLCDKYATRQMYGYCPSWALQWEYRKKGILDELRHYAADLISLQEVETSQFYNFFLPELRRDGFLTPCTLLLPRQFQNIKI